MRAELLSHIGKVRKNNEDAVLCQTDAGLFAIADGIGGQQNGEIASAAAISAIAKLAQVAAENPLLQMREAFYMANDLIYSVGASSPAGGMGTTLTAAWIVDDIIYLSHVGDSRAYLISPEGISLLSEDHSLAGDLFRMGRITEEQARNYPQRNILTRALGQQAILEVYENKETFLSGCYLLLCSDGLYNLVGDEELRAIAFSSGDLASAVKDMVDTALLRGGGDNISVVLVASD